MIHVECPDCAKSYDVADALAGKVAKCKACGGRIPIPASVSEHIAETAAESSVLNSNVASSRKSSQERSNERKSLGTQAHSSKPSSTKPKRPLEKPPQKPSSRLAFDEVNECDESGEDDLFDSFPQFSTEAPRRRGTKKSKGSTALKTSFGWLASFGQFLAKHAVLLVFVLLGMGVLWLIVKTAQGQLVAEELLAITISGLVVCIVADLWLSVRIWRTNPGWAATLMLCNIGLKALAKAQILPIEVIYGLEGIRSVAVIAFVVDHWGELKTPFLTSLLGLCVFLCGLFGAGPRGMPMIARNRNPALAPNGNPVFAPNPNPNPAFVPNPNPAVPQNRVVRLPAPVGVPVAVARKNAVVPNMAAEPIDADVELNHVGPFPLDAVPLPELPEFSLGGGGLGESFSDKSVTCMHQFFVNARSNIAASSRVPGALTKMIYLEPRGTHRPRSLPCVLVASAGTNLLQGADSPSKEYVSETLPYVKAGFAVLGFSVDGYSAGKIGLSEEQLARAHFTNFQKACAGLVNVRNVVEFASKKIPQVDPGRLFIAGHSSAGTLALLAAAHEPRLRAAVAYAPVTDVEARLKDLLAAPESEQLLPGLRIFAKQSSPLTHVERMACPILLFHAADDTNVAVADSRRFADLLKSHDKTVEFVEVPNGNHYDAMLQQGIPRAIRWLRDSAVRKSPSNGRQGNPAVAAGRPDAARTNQPESNLELLAAGRVVTFRFQSFSGKGDSTAAARQALRNISWADPNDLEIDAAKGEIRIGQLGGSVNSEPARQALLGAGFQLVGGVSIGAKKPATSATPEPTRPANPEPEAPATSIPAENPFTTKTPSSKATGKPATPTVTEPTAPKESGPPRRVVTFRYERYSGKGSSANAASAALKKIAWADPNDIEVDAAKREIRVGQLEESKEYEPAEKALKNAGFSLAPGVTSGLRKR